MSIQKPEIKKKISCTLMAANLIATILVIAIHYSSKGKIDISNGYSLNYLFQDFLTNGIARIAVPFFAFVSGFFLKNKLRKTDYYSILKNKTKTLLLPYLTASATIFILMNLWRWGFKSSADLPPNAFSIFHDILVQPISIQFWFLRDLIFLNALSPILLGKNRFQGNVLVSFLGILWLCDLQIFPQIGDWYLVNIETIFFFCIGGLIAERNSILDRIADAHNGWKIAVFSVWLMLVGLRVYIDPSLDNWYVRDYSVSSIFLYKAAIVVGIVSLVQISSFLADNKSTIYFSGLTFFAYLFHQMPTRLFIEALVGKIANEGISFYISLPIAVISVFFAAHVASKHFPVVYSYMTGGRDPRKSLKRVH